MAPERRRRAEKKNFFDATSVINGVLIAGITATLIHLFSIPHLEEKINALTQRVEKNEQEMTRMRSELYAPKFETHGKLAAFEPIKGTGNGTQAH
jgi:hypothetical protein